MQTTKILTLILPALLSLLVIASGIAKLAGAKKIVEGFTTMDMLAYLKVFGIAEIVFAILFMIPVTSNIGFILLVCYFSGALATDLTNKRPIMPPLVILSLLFVAVLIKSPALFFPGV